MDKEYYVATKDEKGDFLIYESNAFKLSEIDLINLIKICIVEKRNSGIGRRLLEAYKDSTDHRQEVTLQRLNQIGIKEDGKREPTRIKKSQ